MAQLARALLLAVVILAPGGLLLLPFLAVHHFKKAHQSSTANEHAHVH